MSNLARVLLFLISTGTFFWVMRKIRKSQVQIENVVFWVLFILGLYAMSIFPGIIFFLSRLFHIDTPSSFVFICMIFFLMLKVFNLSMQVSKLQYQLQQLTQIIALKEYQDEQLKVNK